MTKKKWTKKIKPGIATFGPTPDLVGSDYLEHLFQHAVDIIPKHEVPNTPIFLLATAGMRLLPDAQRSALLAEVCAYARESTQFQLPECDLHIQVIPGETEGLYGWIAANYLLGGFDHPESHAHGKGHHTYGFLDMGGASAQIAFAPNATEAERHAEDLKLLRLRTIDGTSSEYRVFVTTWLEYGANEARRRYVEALIEATDISITKELPDPCLPTGLTVTKTGDVIISGSPEDRGKEVYLVGTGNFAECLRQTFPLLDKAAPCPDPPCLLHGVHVPAIDFDVNHFVGVSEYWHTTHQVFEMGHADKAYDFNTYQHRVNEFCSQDWSAISEGVMGHKWGDTVVESTAVEVCFKASWLINMLHDGIGIPRAGLEDTHRGDHNGTSELLDAVKDEGYLAPFQAVNKIDNTEVSWTLGKMVLYASSQIPPADDSILAVGFGSNIPSSSALPSDFQFAGGAADRLGSGNPLAEIDNDDIDFGVDDDDDADIDDDDDGWSDRLLSTPARHAGPSIVVVLLVLFALVLLLLGRDRRAAVFRFFFRRRRSGPTSPSSPRRRRAGLGSKFPFKLGGAATAHHKYDRVLEDGLSDGVSGGDFELGALSSDSDEHEGEGSSRSSGGSGGSGGSGAGRRATRPAGFVSPRLYVPPTPSTGVGGSDYFDNPGTGVGLGLTPLVAIDKIGLARTESRERLMRTESRERPPALARTESSNRLTLTRTESSSRLAAIGQSRGSSPTRWRSPLMMPVKENVD